MSKPKKPKATAEELFLRRRAVEEQSRLDAEENRRLKRVLRSNFRSSLLSGSERGITGQETVAGTGGTQPLTGRSTSGQVIAARQAGVRTGGRTRRPAASLLQ